MPCPNMMIIIFLIYDETYSVIYGKIYSVIYGVIVHVAFQLSKQGLVHVHATRIIFMLVANESCSHHSARYLSNSH